MSDVLREICDKKREHIAFMKARRPLSTVLEDANNARATRGFHAALETSVAAGRYGLIAEIKRASPSKGLIRKDFNPSTIAPAYAKGGASCLSVLTDGPYFSGADDHLSAARAVVDLPVLRKDFMVDPYQIVEARALGADCILLIMAALDDGLARELEALALAHGMDALIEVHDEDELERALKLSSPLIGINNRNLKTLKTDTATTLRLAPLVPDDRIAVCESGLKGSDDLARMSAVGANCFLIGESLMREPDIEAATARLLAEPAIQPRVA
ncbi:MAG: indole-3-glycerol phosphate synthase TrpC [Pseudomonadota bacterium]|nr:indole-3-glycerol phosphate synthase TrpC [Pseudomonadota bacterium]